MSICTASRDKTYEPYKKKYGSIGCHKNGYADAVPSHTRDTETVKLMEP